MCFIFLYWLWYLTHGTGITTTICAFWYREVGLTNYQKSIGSATLRPCRASYLSLWQGSTVRVVPMLPHGDKQPIEMAQYHITVMYIIWLFQCILSPLWYVWSRVVILVYFMLISLMGVPLCIMVDGLCIRRISSVKGASYLTYTITSAQFNYHEVVPITCIR